MADPRYDLAGNRNEELAAPEAERQRRKEQNHGVNAFPSGARPINIGQIEPQREFIQRQRRADAIKYRCQPRPAAGCSFDARADLNEPEPADEQQDQNSEHQMMNMRFADKNATKPDGLTVYGVSDRARSRESDEETDCRKKQSLAARIGEMSLIKSLQFTSQGRRNARPKRERNQ